MLVRTALAVALSARLGARALMPIALVVAPRLGVHRSDAQTLDAGSQLQIRLLDPVSSRHGMRGHRVRALVIAPAPSDTAPVVAPATLLWGTITEAGEEHHPKRRRFVTLEFTSLETPHGQRAPIATRVSAVDNARETVDTSGRILGLPDPGLVHSKADWALLVLGTVHPVGAAALFATVRGESREQHRTIDFPRGVEMHVQLTAAAAAPAWPEWQGPPALAGAALVDSLLRTLPPRTYAFGGTKPADLINVALIGSEAEIRAAFLAAGWESAERLSIRTGFDTFIAAAKARGYSHQPVSQLLLDGRPPDFVFQKLTDTFAKRHHVRIWRWPALWKGRPIFLAAATHDVGIEFLTREHTFTHRVDPRIDLERDKVVDDFITAGLIDALSFARRTPIPGVTMNRERNPVVTDWRVAIAALGASR
jgi:hypothetical protein